MPQKLVYIHSITPGSLADRCNKFKVGDEIVMVGNDLMVGLTWKAASDKINQLAGSFKIVAQRRENAEAESEEKQQHKEMEQNGSDSCDGDSDDKSILAKKELPAIVPTNNHSQLSVAGAQQHSKDTETTKVTTSAHPEQPVVPSDHTDDITFTIKVRVYLFICFSISCNISYS